MDPDELADDVIGVGELDDGEREPDRQPRGIGRRKWDRVKTFLAYSAPLSLLVSGVIGYVAIRAAWDAENAADAASDLAGQVRDEERRQIDLVRRASWRLCERDMRDRALAHAFIPPGPELRLVERQNPIVNCDPNLRGEPAYALPRDEQRAFVERWRRGELEPLPEPPGAEPGLRPR